MMLFAVDFLGLMLPRAPAYRTKAGHEIRRHDQLNHFDWLSALGEWLPDLATSDAAEMVATASASFGLAGMLSML